MPDIFKVNSPYDGHLICELDTDDEACSLTKLKTAYELASDRKKIIPLHQRIEILKRTAELVNQRKDEFARQAAEEGGKPLLDSKVELDRAIQGIREAANSVNRIVGREIPMGLTPGSANRKAFTIREPIGTVVAISAFNHPLNLIVHQVIPAVAVGCPVIVKPALTTPISCLNIVKTLQEAGLPKEWCQTALCSNEVAEKLATDPRTAFLTFIGSGKVGWSLRSKLSPGTRCGLEHGGVAPVIIEPDTDIQDALPALAKGGFYHAGQVCVSVQRIFVHEAICKEFTSKLAKLADKLIVGNPLDEITEVGPLISEGEVRRVHQWVQEAIKSGAKLVTGGKIINKTCYKPTILFNPPNSSNVNCHEVFGPVVNVYSYKDLKEAIDQANSLRFSFQAAIFTKNLDVAFDTAKHLNASAVMINDHTAFRVDWMPFAGYMESGLGVGGILPAMEEMTLEKMMVFRSPAL